MPQILVVTDSANTGDTIVYRERVSSADLESAHFSSQLVERVGWAVRDANVLEHEDRQTRSLPRRRDIPHAA